MTRTALFLLLTSCLFSGVVLAQPALISGRVINEKGLPMAGVSIVVLGNQSGITSGDSGYFSIQVKAGRATGLVFSYAGYNALQRNYYLNPGEREQVLIQLLPGDRELAPVEVSRKKDRLEAGLITINPKLAISSPAPIAGIENMIKVLVGSNNELTSQYTVRGGNYDENLVYINDFEVFRPYLVRSGQQEGLSFINPELVRNVNFYNGGFQARYGDKMSSVLDVQYKKPSNAAGSAYAGLLEQGLHVEGSAGNGKLTYLAGTRNRSLRNLLSSQETKGNYMPSSSDLQWVLNWQPSASWNLEMMGNLSATRFELEPAESRQTTSVFTPRFSANLGLDVNYSGREKDRFSTSMAGLSVTRIFNKHFRLKGMLSHFRNREEEKINIGGSYLFGERSFDKSSADFGLITNPLGAGVFLNYARNNLDVNWSNASLKGTWNKGPHFVQFGSGLDLQQVNDRLLEFEHQDSAGYSLPNRPGPLHMFRTVSGSSRFDVLRFSAYVQDNMVFRRIPGLTMQAGLRIHSNNLNGQWLLSPRMGWSYTPGTWKKDVIFRGSAGFYSQPPFYREMRRPDGSVNTSLKAQQSWQASAGWDAAFKWMNRPFRLNTEMYYKHMWDVVPYDIDNVRLRYFGENNARAYAYGAEARLFGELVKDAESWLSIGFMKTMEDLEGDYYYKYYNKQGELITAQTADRIPADSTKTDIGWLRRPTDRRLNIGLFFSDYLTTNKNFRVFLQGLYGSNMPFNIPGSVRYRNALEIPAYFRVDVGFTWVLISGDKSRRRSHDPFRGLNDMWLTFETFNLLDRSNTISFAMIRDFDNNAFAIPNRLTPRLINLKLSVRW